MVLSSDCGTGEPYTAIHMNRIAAQTALVALGWSMMMGSALAAAPKFSTPNVTRGEAAMILLQSRFSSLPKTQNTGQFTDIPKGAWYEQYMLLAEKYGILSADPVKKKLYPDDPIHRAEFLRMLSYTFGVTENLPFSYRDVTKGSWQSMYSGVASTYRLFPKDTDKGLLKPNAELTHLEVARAIQLLKDALASEEAVRQQQIALAREQAAFRLQTYQRMSSDREFLMKVRSTVPVNIDELIVRYPGDDPLMVPNLRAEVLRLVNEERKKANVQPLIMNSKLEQTAQNYAKTMATQGFFGHVTPEGQTLKDRLEPYTLPQKCTTCVERYEVGENIAQGQFTPQEVMRDWMNSPSHKAAILSSAFRELGIGISGGIWVQHFGGKK